MQIKFNPVLLRTQNLLKMWQSINGLIGQRTPKGFKSALLSLGNVVHSDNNEESLYACCCTQKVTVRGMGVRRNFSRWVAKSTFCLSSSGCWRCNANGRAQTASLFLHHKEMPDVTTTVAYSVFPLRKFYTWQMLVLVSMDILRLI